jgi:AP-3 complex subunit beta
VKQVASQHLDIRKLVYIYLLRYATQEPDLALLSINTFQRDLEDRNQMIRAMALRVMTGIRVPLIAPLLVLGVRKCSTDPSPYVRRIAALALSKCYTLDPTQKADLIDILAQLLYDQSPLVIGSVFIAFQELCPERLDLLHSHFRRICHMLIDVDEWGQIAILQVLTRYARTQFLEPKRVSNIDYILYRKLIKSSQMKYYFIMKKRKTWILTMHYYYNQQERYFNIEIVG